MQNFIIGPNFLIFSCFIWNITPRKRQTNMILRHEPKFTSYCLPLQVHFIHIFLYFSGLHLGKIHWLYLGWSWQRGYIKRDYKPRVYWKLSHRRPVSGYHPKKIYLFFSGCYRKDINWKDISAYFEKNAKAIKSLFTVGKFGFHQLEDH